MQKEAEDAEAQGREDANTLVAAVSELMIKKAGETPAAPVANTAPAPATDEQTKLAELMKDENVVTAVKTLKAKGLL